MDNGVTEIDYDPLLNTVSGQGILDASINIVYDYLDNNSEQKKTNLDSLKPQGIQIAETMNTKPVGRPRASTMEEFDKF